MRGMTGEVESLELAKVVVSDLLDKACGDADVVSDVIRSSWRDAREDVGYNADRQLGYQLLVLALTDITGDARYRFG